MNNTYVEIEAWGDFDVKYTTCIMFAEGPRDVDHILNNFCQLNGLPGLSGLPSNMLGDTNEALIKFLRKEGFKMLKTNKICFSD